MLALPAFVAAALLLRLPASSGAADALCSLEPAPTIALLQVERDTTLPYAPARATPLSYSGVRQSPGDSLLVMPGDPMPAARVRMMRIDSATRRTLTAAGVTDSQPAAFIAAAPYRADCRTIRYTDRPTRPANDSRVVLPGELMFHMDAAPEPLWDAREALVRPPSRGDSLLMAQVNRPIERDRLQPRIPITVRLDANGGVRADTALAMRGGTLRVLLERVDTLAVVRPF